MSELDHAPPKPNNTAWITPKMFCRVCGWPVIHVCCNDEMNEKPWGDWNYWAYCSNKGCQHHEGEEWETEDPSFTFRDRT